MRQDFDEPFLNPTSISFFNFTLRKNNGHQDFNAPFSNPPSISLRATGPIVGWDSDSLQNNFNQQ